jgi:hypothetical protein
MSIELEKSGKERNTQRKQGRKRINEEKSRVEEIRIKMKVKRKNK